MKQGEKILLTIPRHEIMGFVVIHLFINLDLAGYFFEYKNIK